MARWRNYLQLPINSEVVLLVVFLEDPSDAVIDYLRDTVDPASPFWAEWEKIGYPLVMMHNYVLSGSV